MSGRPMYYVNLSLTNKQFVHVTIYLLSLCTSQKNFLWVYLFRLMFYDFINPVS